MPGIEPGTSSLPRMRSTPELQRLKGLPGFDSTSSGRRDSNPRPSAWKADALPTELLPLRLWAGKDLNLRRLTSSDLQSDAFNHSATDPTKSEPLEGFEPPTR